MRESACVPLDKSVFAAAFSAVLMHVWQHSLPQLCLRWSKVKQQEALRAQPSSLQSWGDSMKILTAATNKNTNKGSGLGTHSLSSLCLWQRLNSHCDHSAAELWQDLKVCQEDKLKIQPGAVDELVYGNRIRQGVSMCVQERMQSHWGIQTCCIGSLKWRYAQAPLSVWRNKLLWWSTLEPWQCKFKALQAHISLKGL